MQKLDWNLPSLLHRVSACVCVWGWYPRCFGTWISSLSPVSPSLPWGVNIILYNLFQTRSMFPYLGFRTVATFSTSLSDPFTLWQFPLWLFKLVILEDFVFSSFRQVAPHNSVILRYCYLAFIVSWRFSLIEINYLTLVSIIVIIFSSLHLSLSRFCLWGFYLSHPSPICSCRGSCEIIYFSCEIYCMLTDALKKNKKNIASLFSCTCLWFLWPHISVI